MKTNIFSFIVLLSIFSFASCVQPYVLREKPREIKYTRPASPGPDYVWTGGEWIYVVQSPNHRQWQEGHWEKTRPGKHWVDGHWKPVNRGFMWIPGRWRHD
jgi:hypothetical protein